MLENLYKALLKLHLDWVLPISPIPVLPNPISPDSAHLTFAMFLDTDLPSYTKRLPIDKQCLTIMVCWDEMKVSYLPYLTIGLHGMNLQAV